MNFQTIKRQGKEILDDIFFEVLTSEDKTLWKDAIDALQHHIARLKVDVQVAAAENREDATFRVRQLWAWESALDQLCSVFGYKFIHPFLHSSHDRPDTR